MSGRRRFSFYADGQTKTILEQIAPGDKSDFIREAIVSYYKQETGQAEQQSMQDLSLEPSEEVVVLLKSITGLLQTINNKLESGSSITASITPPEPKGDNTITTKLNKFMMKNIQI